MSHESELARCQRDDVTHHAGCACHEQGWQNKWECAVEMAAQAENERDRLRLAMGELIAAVRINYLRGTFVATERELDAWLERWTMKLNPVTENTSPPPLS